MIQNSRQAVANQPVVGQVDLFQVDGFTRLTGLTVLHLACDLWYSNARMAWSFQSGTTLSDVQIASGTVYFNEIQGSPGFYSVRFRPNVVGYWRLVLSYATGLQVVCFDFDVVASPSDNILQTSFIRPA